MNSRFSLPRLVNILGSNKQGPSKHQEGGAEHIYAPIQSRRGEIRLVKILPSVEEDSIIECHMSKYYLTEQPDYIALSYMWGNPSITDAIIVNGKPLQVTTNLGSALRQLRTLKMRRHGILRRKKSLRFWIDSICINQNDDHERNDQVQLMRYIYTTAMMVISWTGADEPVVSTAMKWLTTIAQASLSLTENEDKTTWMQNHSELFQQDINNDLNNKAWNSIKRFFDLPVWSRVWILQEMVLARSLWMMSEDGTKLELDDVFVAMDWIRQIQDGSLSKPEFFPSMLWDLIAIGQQISFSNLAIVRGFRQEFESPGELRFITTINAVRLSAFYHATDPRDQIYGFIGIIRTGIVADYTSSVARVYVEVAKKLYSESSTLEFLDFSGVTDPENQFGLPSWVPNWHHISSNPQYPQWLQSTDFEEGEDIDEIVNERVSFINQSVLRTYGVCCDTVSVTAAQLPESESFFQFCCRYISQRESDNEVSTPPLQSIFLLVLRGRDPFTKELLADQLSSDLTCSVGLAFLSTLFDLSMMGDPDEFLHSLHLDPGEKLQESFLKRFLPTAHSEKILLLDLNPNRRRTNLEVLIFVEIAQMNGKQIFHSYNGYSGLALNGVLPKDIICILHQYNLPVVLRQVGTNYTLIGPCYVSNLVKKGRVQLFKARKAELQAFDIC
jgi:hypothetical protein